MIFIRFDGYSMTATGHAGYGKYGEDIVCAGVSSLLAAAAETMMQMEEEGMLNRCRVELKPGNARLEMEPNARGQPSAAAIMAMLRNGSRLIAAQYGQYVVITGENPRDKESAT